MVTDPQRAPAGLESVRRLLNTWLIPNDTRTPADRFQAYARARKLGGSREAESLRALRDEVRGQVETASRRLGRLDPWLVRCRVRPVLRDGRARVEHRHDGSAAGAVLAAVLEAVQDGTWLRLKACPDCRWVFFDHSRNGTKRWCLMNAGGRGGRACGTNAKVRRFRERQRKRRP